MRIPGVLQRIGLCYFAAAIILRRTSSRAALWRHVGADVRILGAVDVGAARRRRSVAGRQSGAHVDRALLGGHLWKPDWDPEGLLSTIPAVATTLLGAVSGHLDAVRETRARVVRHSLPEASLESSSAWRGTWRFRSTRTSGPARTCSSPPAWPPSSSPGATRASTRGRRHSAVPSRAHSSSGHKRHPPVRALVGDRASAGRCDIGGVTAKGRLYDGWFAPSRRRTTHRSCSRSPTSRSCSSCCCRCIAAASS